MWSRFAARPREGTDHRVRPRTAVICTVAGVLAVAGTTTLAVHGGSARASTSAAATGSGAGSAVAAPSPGSASPTPSATLSPTGAPSATVTATPSAPASTRPTDSGDGMDALKDAVARASGNASVSVVDLTTGASLDYGAAGHSFVTASIVKLDILATLLLQTQGQGGLSTSQRALATSMIENSDNDAANSLYLAIGAHSGLDAANKRFGLGSTQGGTDDYWGLTTTTAADQVKLLRQVFTGSSLLDAASREYVQGLLRQVETDQRWGVSAAATGDYQLKNGWLPRSATGLWVINSTGLVDHDGHQLLISVLSDGNLSESQGITLVESVAKAAAETVG
ncbi:serine hydrolase [Streptacidiphilus cavernicola]|uniref:Serine hydrolase n=1 Tax=Streptacidiphilus cavernicola TaxID=3342716 RepID=A0ABV6VQ82_9ACTN